MRLVRERGRPVRTGLIDSADRTWTTLLFLTEDGSALVALRRLATGFQEATPSGVRSGPVRTGPVRTGAGARHDGRTGALTPP